MGPYKSEIKPATGKTEQDRLLMFNIESEEMPYSKCLLTNEPPLSVVQCVH